MCCFFLCPGARSLWPPSPQPEGSSEASPKPFYHWMIQWIISNGTNIMPLICPSCLHLRASSGFWVINSVGSIWYLYICNWKVYGLNSLGHKLWQIEEIQWSRSILLSSSSCLRPDQSFHLSWSCSFLSNPLGYMPCFFPASLPFFSSASLVLCFPMKCMCMMLCLKKEMEKKYIDMLSYFYYFISAHIY